MNDCRKPGAERNCLIIPDGLAGVISTLAKLDDWHLWLVYVLECLDNGGDFEAKLESVRDTINTRLSERSW